MIRGEREFGKWIQLSEHWSFVTEIHIEKLWQSNNLDIQLRKFRERRELGFGQGLAQRYR